MTILQPLEAWASRHRDLAELALGLGIAGGILLVSLSQWGFTDTGFARGVILGVPLAAITAWGYRRRRQRDERRERAVLEQRLRVARELHDAVAGQVAIVGIQAAAARRILASRPDEAAVALERIESASRSAVGDLRRMLATLRDGADPTEAGTLPGLGDLRRLVDDARRAGLDVESEVAGSRPADLPMAVDHAAYRIVQEALTNGLKHGGPGRSRLDIRYTDDAVEMRLRSPIRTGAHGTRPGGMGLVGIRERAALFDGDAFTGPGPEGTWLVDVRLPTRSRRT